MARGISVYQLRDPRTEQVRYIGYSRDPRRRLRGHLTDQSDTHKVRWIRLLLERNLKPQLRTTRLDTRCESQVDGGGRMRVK